MWIFAVSSLFTPAFRLSTGYADHFFARVIGLVHDFYRQEVIFHDVLVENHEKYVRHTHSSRLGDKNFGKNCMDSALYEDLERKFFVKMPFLGKMTGY